MYDFKRYSRFAPKYGIWHSWITTMSYENERLNTLVKTLYDLVEREDKDTILAAVEEREEARWLNSIR